MSTAAFPTLLGLGWSLTRTSQWATRKPVAISGKETAIADWSYPRYTWELTFDFLQQGQFAGGTAADFATLLGFYNARQGGFDSFLYTDQDDNSVTGQRIGLGDGSTTQFQMVRAFGGFAEPIYAINFANAVNIYLNGVKQTSGYSLTSNGSTSWESAAPGIVTFATAPASGVAITADFTYQWPCRFVDDKCAFEKFMANLYLVKKLTFMSIK